MADRLCAVCAMILFDVRNGKHSEWPLGSLHQVRNSTNCSLCRLITLAIFEGTREMGPGSDEFPENRKVVLRWRGDSFFIDRLTEKCRLGFVRTDSTSTERTQWILPIPTSPVDLSTVRRWISLCINDHGSSCSSCLDNAGNFGLEALRLVDVIEERVTEIRNVSRYLALSYVWGGVPNVRLTTGNKRSLMKIGGLRDIFFRLPRTIRDTIVFVRALGERYLWIDSLCLVQNDHFDMQNGIGAMDKIYERAFMTIIAACGDNANHHLSGATAGSRFNLQHMEEVIPGTKLAVYCALDHRLQRCTYSQRAWT